jgi:cell division protein FtsI/penicillin-binding protein 2
VILWTRRAVLLAAATVRDGEFEYIEIDVRSGEVLRSRWQDAIHGVFPGSLVKPFTALAFGGPKFPRVKCTGCWGGKVHGEVDLVRAIELSCNRYFEELALRVEHQRMLLVTAEYGLTPPPDDVDARIGLGRAWRVQPGALLKAYARLVVTNRVSAILEGMRRCASSGTGRAVGAGSLAKTGTAPCEHSRPMPGDGLAVALWPAEDPRRAVLVREHGVPGAIAAKRIKGILSA